VSAGGVSAQQLAEIEARLTAATPGPWAWGDGWRDLIYLGPDQFEGADKYADLQLTGRDQRTIIGIRIDHYEPIWDTATPADEPNEADREFIAHAPADIAVLVEAVKALRAALTSVTGACEQVAWTNRGMADVSRDGYWSFVPTEAVRRAAAVLGTFDHQGGERPA
jgi:hypothetical protein